MPRPYGDPVEVVTGPIPAQSPFIPADAKIVVGAVAPASPDPIPLVLLPGFEYRMREWRHPDTHESPLAAGAEKVRPAGRRRRVVPTQPHRTGERARTGRGSQGRGRDLLSGRSSSFDVLGVLV